MTTSLNPQTPLLLVDDEPSWLQSLSFTLDYAAAINNVMTCSDSRDVMNVIAKHEVSSVILDLTMPHIRGEELLKQIIQDHPGIPVIILSGMNQVETAVKCMKMGAFDFFVKTVEEERLIAGIQRALAFGRLQQENRQFKDRVLKDTLEHPEAFSEIVTRSRKMRSLFQYIEAIVCSDQPILISGESGVGKELVSSALHRLCRPSAALIAVNVAGLDDNVFADTLFGHTRGAFTGADKGRPGMVEEAGDGILFLDEIGDLSPSSQVKLLRLLQEGEFFPLGSDKPKRSRARVICATNHDLEAKQACGEFRRDLYYRLRAHHVHVPPLRERLEDLPLLVEFFLEEAADRLGKRKPTIPQELTVLLGTYHFPGNIRELRAMIYDAVSLHGGGVLSTEPFRRIITAGRTPTAAAPSALNAPMTFPDPLPTLSEGADLLVQEALRRAKGNQGIAASLLGITRQALNKRLKKLGN
ncbi:MAG TPA: sigma-54 dependent transcriptional regulator [Desulfuromonadales bacterium]|nr:sigma-54 dependent transcriptional regulator [Desulfuromonadales bacterium]